MEVRDFDSNAAKFALLGGIKNRELTKSLAKKPAKTLEDLKERCEKYINMEETLRARRDLDKVPEGQGRREEGSGSQRPPKKAKKERRDRYDDYTPLNAPRSRILREVYSTEMADVPAPRPLRVGTNPDMTRWCAFHKVNGHSTDQCYDLRDVVESLIRQGRLRQYVRKGGSPVRSPRRSPTRRTDEPPKRRRSPRRDGRPNREDTSRRDPSPRREPDRQKVNSPRRRDRQDRPRSAGPTRTINTIAGGFGGGGTTRSARKRHLREVMSVGSKPWRRTESSSRPPAITFSAEDGDGVAPGHDDPMVVTGIIANAKVKRIFLDQGSSADVLFMDVFNQLGIPKEDLKPVQTDLVGFSGGKIRPEGYVELYLTMGEEKRDGDRVEKTVKVKFLVVDCPSAYNAILGRPSLNALGAIISTQYLAMKFADRKGRIATVRADQAQARQCYIHSLEVNPASSKWKGQSHESRKDKGKEKTDSAVMLTELDMRDEIPETRPQPDGNLEDFQIGEYPGQTTKIGADLPEPDKSELKAVLIQNKDLFAWTAADMPGLDPGFICHHLAIAEGVQPVAQRKRKMGPERQAEIEKQVRDLLKANFIREVSYTTWLANVVLVKKASGK